MASRSQQLGHGLDADGSSVAVALGHLDSDLATDRGKLSLEVPQPGFLGVVGDDLSDRGGREGEVLPAQAVSPNLPGNQVPAGDLELLLGRVAAQPDDLHPIEKRRLDRVQQIGGGDEHDL